MAVVELDRPINIELPLTVPEITIILSILSNKAPLQDSAGIIWIAGTATKPNLVSHPSEGAAHAFVLYPEEGTIEEYSFGDERGSHRERLQTTTALTKLLGSLRPAA